jgi:hypothetical protein
MKSCWHSEPSARPTFDELDKRFKTMDIAGVFSTAFEKRKRDLMKDSNRDALIFQVCVDACVCVHERNTESKSLEYLTFRHMEIIQKAHTNKH